jgi:guanine deaminase
VELPARAPFTLRARLITPLNDGSTLHEPDALVAVDAGGHIARVARAEAGTRETDQALDLRPFVLVPGLVDLHAHLPQLPNAGIGFGMDLLAWLERHIFPLERRWADPAIAERVAPAAFRAMAGAGTTTVLAYGAVYEESLDVAFRAAEAHGIRAVLGKVMMDRVTYDERRSPGSPELTELSLRQSADLCSRWHGRDGGRLRYAFTPRFAVACTADLLRESATLARDAGATWQTHLSEDRGEIEAVAGLFPGTRDYVDVYDRAGGVGPNAVFAHAVHLSDRELARLVEAGAHVAHCPGSNLFLASGVMPLARYLRAGLSVGMGSDVAAGPEVSIWSSMRIGAYCQNAWRVMLDDTLPVLAPLDWLRLASLEGARALGLADVTGSLEEGKEADLVVIDPSATAAIDDEGGLAEVRDALADPSLLVSRLMFRASAGMVRASYVRGRRLATSA